MGFVLKSYSMGKTFVKLGKIAKKYYEKSKLQEYYNRKLTLLALATSETTKFLLYKHYIVPEAKEYGKSKFKILLEYLKNLYNNKNKDFLDRIKDY